MVDVLDVLKYDWALSQANESMKRFAQSSFLTDLYSVRALYVDDPTTVVKHMMDEISSRGLDYTDLDDDIKDKIEIMSDRALKALKTYEQSGAKGYRYHVNFEDIQKVLVEHAYGFMQTANKLLCLKTILENNERLIEMANMIKDMAIDQCTRMEKEKQEKEKQKREKDTSSDDGSDIDAIMGGPLVSESVSERLNSLKENTSAASEMASALKEQLSKTKGNVLAASNKIGGASDTAKEMVPPETIFRN